MPRHALESGCVDFELTPTQIGRELVKIARSQKIAYSQTSQPSENKG
jgi:chemotaxis response regulator CheB